MKLLIPYLLSVALLVVVDLVWLGVVMVDFYQGHLGHLMAGKLNWFAAIVFYPLYVAGVYIFAILPAVREGKMLRALTLGVLLGLLAYGTYDLSNQVTLREWPLTVTLVDMAWGAVITGVISMAGFLLVRLYNRPKQRHADEETELVGG